MMNDRMPFFRSLLARSSPAGLAVRSGAAGIIWLLITAAVLAFTSIGSSAFVLTALSSALIFIVATTVLFYRIAARGHQEGCGDSRTESIVAAMTEGVSIQDRGFRILYQNPAHKAMAGDHGGELCYEAYAFRGDICPGCPVARSFQDGGMHMVEKSRPADGGTQYAEIYASPLRSRNGEIIAVIEAVRDITARKLAEHALQESETRYRTLFEKAGDAIFILDAEGERAGAIVDANEAAAAMHGYTVQELLRMRIMDLDSPDAAREAPGRILRIVNGEWLKAEITHRRKDGTVFPVELSAGLLTIEGHRYILAIDRDVSDRRAAEEFRKNILEAVDEAFIVVDRDFRVRSVNAAYCRQVKLPEDRILGKHCYEVSHKRDTPCWLAGEECTVQHTFQTGEPHAALHTHTDSDGTSVYVETKSFPMKNAGGEVFSAIEIINDVTGKRKLEEQLRHAQKMEAVGTLTGGIAHDFNNILTTILGYASFFQKKMAPDDPFRPAVDHIFTAARRASNLTRSLLAFSRKQSIRPAPEDLNEIVRRLEKLLLRIIGEDVELITDLASGEIMMLADSGQMEQVIMNLCTNARDAMPDGGVLTIVTGIVDLDEERALAHGLEAPGAYSLLTVSDSGTGIDEQTREKIFDPFFTTKEVGKGTGLGLSIVYGIIRQHGGAVDVTSERGVGTIFRVYVPLISGHAAAAAAPAESVEAAGTETVLVAEDDQDVRELICQTLGELGYRVIAAVDGEDAISAFSRHRDAVQLLILDVIMPKMNGKEVYETLRRISPDVKVLFISGYTADILSKKGVLPDQLNFLPKPLTPDDLARKVREVLG